MIQYFIATALVAMVTTAQTGARKEETTMKDEQRQQMTVRAGDGATTSRWAIGINKGLPFLFSDNQDTSVWMTLSPQGELTIHQKAIEELKVTKIIIEGRTRALKIEWRPPQ